MRRHILLEYMHESEMMEKVRIMSNVLPNIKAKIQRTNDAKSFSLFMNDLLSFAVSGTNLENNHLTDWNFLWKFSTAEVWTSKNFDIQLLELKNMFINFC